jgi:uncharacterized cofD-like protein
MALGRLKHNLAEQRRQLPERTTHRVGQWFKWMRPGLSVKRWFFISLLGGSLILLGAAIWADLTPIYALLRLIRGGLSLVTQVIPSQVSGPLVLLGGALLLYWGQTRTVGTITEVLMPDQDEELVDVLIQHRRLNRGPKVVAIGGGTGLSTLLRGLKRYSSNITAIVTVADDGGSTGRLRREMGIQAPGDIRSCLTALANEEKLLTELFRYRFEKGEGLSGHSFGNLFLTAMTAITGDFEKAIAASSNVLAVQGCVLPSTLSNMQLWAELSDGRRIEGESSISEANGQIVRIGCQPPNPPALPAAIKAIQEADYIIIGPGSLFTSIIPNLLVPDLRQAIAQSEVPRVYVCNIMTQPGETTGYTVSDHIATLDRVTGEPLFDAVLTQRRPPSALTVQHYAHKGSHPVFIDRDVIRRQGRRVILANIMDENGSTGVVRHDSDRLAQALMRWYKQVSQSG